jgi:hypothetical protein
LSVRVSAFVGRHRDAGAFKESCLKQAGGRELRRQTDLTAHTPFSAYNLRLYRQTFHALNDVIGPLVVSGAAVAVPMQPPSDGRALLVEVCPASTLIDHAVRVPYKQKAQRSARANLVEWLVRTTPMAIPADIRARAIRDANGDAVDALIAAAAAWRASRAVPSSQPLHRLEGFVYL